MRKLSAFLVAILLAACTTVPPATGMPATPGLQSTNTLQTTPIPNITGIPPTATPTTVEATATSLPRLEGGTPVTLDSLHMIDLNIGWGIERGGHIIRTRDRGGTWQDVTPPQGLYNDAGFFALDADTAWATLKPSDACDASQMMWDEYLVCLPGPEVIIWRTVDEQGL